MHARICPICGNHFVPSHPKNKTCSRSCGTKLQHRTFDMSGSNNPNWKGGHVDFLCEQCGGIVKKTLAGRGKKRFCSIECANLFQRANPYPGPKKEKAAVTCRQCGGIVEVIPGLVKRKPLCSEECHLKWRSNISGGEGNPNWKGGISRDPYPWNWSAISAAIRYRDSMECQNILCETPESRKTAHHIDYDKKNCIDNNLITLCETCNSKANFNRECWREHYSKLMVALVEE